MLTRSQKMLKEAANHTIIQKNLTTMTEQVVEIIAMISIRTRITMENVIIATNLAAKIMVPAAKTMKTASGSEVKKRTKTTAEIASIIKFRTVKINSKGFRNAKVAKIEQSCENV